MKAGHKYFMPAVKLAGIEDKVQKARQSLENSMALSAIADIRWMIKELADASEELYKIQCREQVQKIRSADDS